MKEAATAALEAEDEIYYHYGKEPTPFEESTPLQNLLNAGYRQTAGSFSNLTATTANTVSGAFEQALDRAWLQVSSGAFDYKTAVKRAVDGLADSMPYVTYPSGHRDTLEVACRRAVLTGVNQTGAKLQEARMDEMGASFVEVTAHGGARPSHAVWQGRRYHRGGAVDYLGQHYEDFESATGYGTGAGLCGWNCRHTFFVVFPELGSPPAWTQESLEALNARDIEYEAELTKLRGDMQAQADGFAFDSALNTAIMGKKGRSVKAVRALLDMEALKSSKDRTTDIDKALEEAAKANPWAFGEAAEGGSVHVSSGAEHGTPPTGDTDAVTAAFKAMNPGIKID